MSCRAMVGSLNERDDVDGILAKMHTCLALCSLLFALKAAD